MDKRKPLKGLKTGLLSRGSSIAKLSLKLGARAATQAIGTVFQTTEGRAEQLKAFLTAQATLMTEELGQLKGSLMKAGQMLSVYGEQFLPPEANEMLKLLQSDSPPVEWPKMLEVLKAELTPETLASLTIESEPIAAASLGQVHRARWEGRSLALKIQYPKVSGAIDSDLRAIKRLLSLARLIPNDGSYEPVFEEIREMLVRELDYPAERAATERFALRLAQDPRFRIPKIYPELSSAHVIASDYLHGERIDSPDVLALPQAHRDSLGEAFLDLYLREIFEFHEVQTDPHFGNYRVDLSHSPPKWILFDFGAVRSFESPFVTQYRAMLMAALKKDRKPLIEAALELGFLRPDDPPRQIDLFCEICDLFIEPFLSESFCWADTDLPKRVFNKGKELLWSVRLRPPPREIVFLDRKITGVFVVLAQLQCSFDARSLLMRYLKPEKRQP